MLFSRIGNRNSKSFVRKRAPAKALRRRAAELHDSGTFHGTDLRAVADFQLHFAAEFQGAKFDRIRSDAHGRSAAPYLHQPSKIVLPSVTPVPCIGVIG